MADLKNRLKFEDDFQSRLAKIVDSHRQKIAADLQDFGDPSKISSATFDQQQQEMAEEIAIALLLIFGASSWQHGLSGLQAAAEADRYARARGQEVARKYIDNTRSIFADAATNVPDPGSPSGSPFGSSPAPSPNWPDILTTAYGDDRIERLVITETTAAASAGSEHAVETLGLKSDEDTWYTEHDGRVCKKCGPLHGRKRPEWSGVFPFGPPAHPRCRCWIEYAYATLPAVP